MPKDNSEAAVEPKRPMTLAEALAELDSVDEDPIEISDLPPLHAADDIRRTPRTQPIPDLSPMAKLWLLIGEGNTGKTVIARYLVEMIIQHGKLDQNMIAALAPGNRNLTFFAPGTMQPPSADPRATASWASTRLTALQRLRQGGVWDFGGGDTSLRLMIEAHPDLAERCEQESLALVAGYLFSPRLDDLAFLNTYERMGFRPRATALVLNLGRADGPSAFNNLRRQPQYKAALDRGAVELWLPPMPQNIALAIEKARVFFAQARDGEAPTGRKPADISLFERVMVREWLTRMDVEFREITRAGWMPWT